MHYALLMAVSKLTLLLFCSTLCYCSLGGSSTEESHIPGSDVWMHSKCWEGMGIQEWVFKSPELLKAAGSRLRVE